MLVISISVHWMRGQTLRRDVRGSELAVAALPCVGELVQRIIVPRAVRIARIVDDDMPISGIILAKPLHDDGMIGLRAAGSHVVKLSGDP